MKEHLSNFQDAARSIVSSIEEAVLDEDSVNIGNGSIDESEVQNAKKRRSRKAEAG